MLLLIFFVVAEIASFSNFVLVQNSVGDESIQQKLQILASKKV